jgi:hypothetical protein
MAMLKTAADRAFYANSMYCQHLHNIFHFLDLVIGIQRDLEPLASVFERLELKRMRSSINQLYQDAAKCDASRYSYVAGLASDAFEHLKKASAMYWRYFPEQDKQKDKQQPVSSELNASQ